MRGGPEQVAELLAGVQAPWYVAAGWAIDLFLGEERREHEDLEIAVPRVRFPEIAERLSGFELFVPDSDLTDPGLVWPFAQAPSALAGNHQTWVREPDERTLAARRLPRALRRRRLDLPARRTDQAALSRRDRADRRRHPVRATGARPALQGEAASCGRRTRPTSRQCYRGSGSDRRQWLADALRLVHPGHPWSERL